MMKRLICILLLPAAAYALPAGPVTVTECLAVRVPRSFSSVWAVDEIESRYILSELPFPQAGDTVRFRSGGTEAWQQYRADSTGWFAGDVFGSGYAVFTITADREKTVLMEAAGCSRFFVNGVPRVGSKYMVKDEYESWEPRFDYVQLPVRLKKGENRIFCRLARGRYKCTVQDIEPGVYVNPRDMTLPDVIIGESNALPAAVLVVNATDEVCDNLSIEAGGEGLETTVVTAGVIQPFSVRKTAFLVKPLQTAEPGVLAVRIRLRAGTTTAADTTVPLAVKLPSQNHRRTFFSGIDGSVQYYAVNPPAETAEARSPALVLSVHGAGVEAVNQAAAYSRKKGVLLAAATNRRAFGYDWEDWGRIDALEVLADVRKHYAFDPDRVYLTGHSMGGHGTWQLGALYPDKWAAIGPSAGWISFSSYAPRQSDAESDSVEALLTAAALSGRTLEMENNYRQHGVYIIHGSADRAVPVEQARDMAARLKGSHSDWQYHEEPGAGHWWDNSPEPGTDCVDWAPMFDFFGRHARIGSDQVRLVDFTTPDPVISADCHWVTVYSRQDPLLPGRVRISMDPHLRRFSGTAWNVETLALDLSGLMPGDSVTVVLDSLAPAAVLPHKGADKIWLRNTAAGWMQTEKPPPSEKGPRRGGLFKNAFNNRVVFVYGTAGTREENQWSFEKARYDGECWWYQGNGSAEIIADSAFTAAAYPGRSVILYGNSSTNAAWKQLLGNDPVQIAAGQITAGAGTLRSDSLACFLIRPRTDSETASVGVVGGTGIAGMRLTNTRPVLYAGYALPDLTVLSAKITRGSREGLAGAGYFGNDWSIENGVFKWRQQLPAAAGPSAHGRLSGAAAAQPAARNSRKHTARGARE